MLGHTGAISFNRRNAGTRRSVFRPLTRPLVKRLYCPLWGMVRTSEVSLTFDPLLLANSAGGLPKDGSPSVASSFAGGLASVLVRALATAGFSSQRAPFLVHGL